MKTVANEKEVLVAYESNVANKIAELDSLKTELVEAMEIESGLRSKLDNAQDATGLKMIEMVEKVFGWNCSDETGFSIERGSDIYKQAKRAFLRGLSGFQSERKASDAHSANAWRRPSKAWDRLPWLAPATEAIPDWKKSAVSAVTKALRFYVAEVAVSAEMDTAELVDLVLDVLDTDTATPDTEDRTRAMLDHVELLTAIVKDAKKSEAEALKASDMKAYKTAVLATASAEAKLTDAKNSAQALIK